jgi:hypothetical protein
MRKPLATYFAIAGLSVSILALGALEGPANAASPPSVAEIQSIQQRNAVLLDAHLAAMKDGLKLTDPQAALWGPFEAAIRDAAKSRAERWLQARERMNGSERPAPLDRLDIMADHLDHNASELRAVASAGKPLYDSLDDTQKRKFGPLMQEFKPKKHL